MIGKVLRSGKDFIGLSFSKPTKYRFSGNRNTIQCFWKGIVIRKMKKNSYGDHKVHQEKIFISSSVFSVAKHK